MDTHIPHIRRFGSWLLVSLIATTVLAGCSGDSQGSSGSGSATSYRDPATNLTAKVPSGWHQVKSQHLSGAVIPLQVASFETDRRVTSICQPGRILDEIPTGGALLQILDNSSRIQSGKGDPTTHSKSAGHALRSTYPRLEKPVVLDKPVGHECGQAYSLSFRVGGHTYQARIWTGPTGLSKKVKRQVEKTLTSLRQPDGAKHASANRKRIRHSSRTSKLSVDLRGAPVDAAVGGGSLWVLTSSGRRLPGHLMQVDIRSGRLVSSHQIRSPQAVAFGQGSVWVADFRPSHVLRFDSQSGKRLASIPLSLPRPVGHARDRRDFLPFDIVAGEGAIWVATARGSVAKINPGCNCVVRQIPIPFESLATIATGEGAVWVGGDLEGIIRIDPESGEKIKIPIGGADGRRLQVGDIRTAAGRVWAAGSWTAPVKRDARTQISGSFKATGKSAIIELNPAGQVLGNTASPAGTTIVPGNGERLWAARWKSRNVFLLDPSPPRLHLVWHLARPAHTLAATDRTLWYIQDGNTLIRRTFDK